MTKIKKISFRAMGSQMMASLKTDYDQAEIILQQVPLWFEEWEQSLSRFRMDSELCQMNRSQGRLFRPSDTLWDVLKLSLQVESQSHGLITPTVINDLEKAGYSKDFDLIKSGGYPVNREFTLTPGIEEIYLDENNRTIVIPIGLRLDFGGVAKGWAAWQTIHRLEVYGPAIMDAGGDIMTSSRLLEGNPWPVAIADPFQPDEDMEMVRLAGEGIATSGQDRRYWKLDGIRMHHIIDVRTGGPAISDVYTATVIAPNVVEAEMAAKMVLIMGSEDGLSWVEEQPNYAAYVVKMDKGILVSKQLSSYLWSKSCQIH